MEENLLEQATVRRTSDFEEFLKELESRAPLIIELVPKDLLELCFMAGYTGGVKFSADLMQGEMSKMAETRKK